MLSNGPRFLRCQVSMPKVSLFTFEHTKIHLDQPAFGKSLSNHNQVTGTRIKGSDIGELTVIFIKLYYCLTVVLTLFVRIGFCLYEVGTAPTKTMLHLEHRCGLGLARVRLDGPGRCAAILQ